METKHPHVQHVIIDSIKPSPFRTPYGPRLRVSLSFPDGAGRTKQAFKDECDINRIMDRFQTTGVLPDTREALARYEDVSDMDYQAAMNQVAAANSLFHGLPSAVRARFDNDPAKLLDFVHDPRNVAESVALGFLDASKLPEGLRPAPQGGGSGATPASQPAASGKAAGASAGKGGAGTAGGSAPSDGE